MALSWPLLAWSAFAQPATVVADTTGEGAAMASVRLVGLGSVTVVAGRYAMAFVKSQLSSFGRSRSVTVLAGQ